MSNNIELLSPAGNMEKLKTAIAFGADAVYAGIPDFSLRVRINDFNLSKIRQATAYCHARDKKIYITVNIFAHNRHLRKLPAYIRKLKEIGVDALIVSDPGVLLLIKKVWPRAVIHLSTQANCTNYQAAQFWHKAGVKRIILGREVSLKEIKEIYKQNPNLELECFVHGAMCMAYSGRCFLSRYFVGRSANLGDCVQPCRWKYFISEEKRPNQPLELIEEQHGSYILNSRDLCLIEYLDKLRQAGITSFKIEGRAKSAYYQAVVTGAYKQAISIISSKLSREKRSDQINYLYNELETKLVHRGYTQGFLLGEKADQEIEVSHQKCAWQFCGQVVKSKKLKDNYLIFIKVHNTIKTGNEIEVIRPFYNKIKIKIDKMQDELTKEEITEAHGGQKKVVIIKNDQEIPIFSVLRRKILMLYN